MSDIIQSGSPRSLSTLISMVSVAGVIAGAMITFFVNMSTIRAENAAQFARIVSLESNYNSLLDREATLRSNVASLQASILEIQTQFCAEDDMRNLMQASNYRVLAVLWNKVNPANPGGSMGVDFPLGAIYYPHVCVRNAHTSGSGQ
jgi:hypothetical protein